MMETIAIFVLSIPLLVLVVPVSSYLAFLTVAAPVGLRKRRQARQPRCTFAVVIPAHNEESVLGRLLSSLGRLEYPPGLVDVYVIADNCTDATAALARVHGVLAFERRDSDRLGKGYALQWLLSELQRIGRLYDAFVVLDADSVVSENFLAVMNDRLAAGDRIIQGYYTVLPLLDSPSELLREAALALVHYLRPAAKMAFGGSCGLKGNGMVFHRSVIEQFGWPSVGLAEDVEFHLKLVASGLKVAFAPEAMIRAEMPLSLRAACTQNQRWEAGRLAAAWRQAAPLLKTGLWRRDIAVLDAAVEQLIPPLSVPVAVAFASFVAGVLLGSRAVWMTAGVALTVLVLHIAAGLIMAKVPIRTIWALAHAPVYVAWKVLIYVRVLFRGDELRWVRTARAESK